MSMCIFYKYERTIAKTSSRKFLELKRRNTVIPPDDINLGEELFWKRFISRTLSEGCLTYMEKIEGILGEAPISKFFRLQLIYEAGLEYRTGWARYDAIDKEAKELLGVSIEDGRYGFFDPPFALKTEKSYFNTIFPLLKWREEAGLFNPVSWEEWARDLAEREGKTN